jgi:solute carrier family 35 (UDP-galactose transporter), member B1
VCVFTLPVQRLTRRLRSYTAQVLAKSCKLIPVMLAGSILYGKRYSVAEYVTALFVAGGIVIFALVKNSDAVMEKLAAPHAPVGYLLVTLNLALDAYTNSTQDMVRCHAFPLMGICANDWQCF